MSKCDNQPEFEFKNMVLNVKCDIRPEFECQNMIPNEIFGTSSKVII